MPDCKLCGSHFNNLQKIDGKTKNLSRRKYCLECSPWGKHNTTRLDKVKSARLKSDDNIVICNRCHKEFLYVRRCGHRRDTCNSCVTLIRKIKIKQRAVDYKGGRCVRCGYNRNIKALQFHHTDPKLKDFHIGGSYNRSWDVIQTELNKCIMLCANCHTEIHDELSELGCGS
jgi:hypothetical protein